MTSERAFLKFIEERESIRIKKEEKKLPPPWTDDPVLRRYHFVNIHRRDDYGTRYLLGKLKTRALSSPDLLFNIMAYRLFNRISTFEVIFPLLTSSYTPSQVYQPLSKLSRAGQAVFTSAHQSASNFEGIRTGDVIKNYSLLFKGYVKFCRKEWEELFDQPTLMDAVKHLRTQKGMGALIAGQVALDLSYFPATRFSDQDPMSLGPGSRLGLTQIYGRLSKKECEDQMLALASKSGIPPSAVEHALCEFSKYTRLKDTERTTALGRVGRQYRPHPQPVAQLLKGNRG